MGSSSRVNAASVLELGGTSCHVSLKQPRHGSHYPWQLLSSACIHTLPRELEGTCERFSNILDGFAAAECYLDNSGTVISGEPELSTGYCNLKIETA